MFRYNRVLKKTKLIWSITHMYEMGFVIIVYQNFLYCMKFESQKHAKEIKNIINFFYILSSRLSDV